MTTAAPSRHLAVIGAGAGGLSAARHLRERGHAVTVFEAGSHVGGLWVYDNDNGLSVAYDSLHINSEPSLTAYRGYPFPPGSPFFLSHREVRAYLDAFADDFGIRELIRFNTRVSSVVPVDGRQDAGWLVTTAEHGEERYDGVVVACGHQGVPAHPDWARDFAGEYLHSNAYREPRPFEGKRVLVVGVGNSGLDIAADLAPFADTHSAARSPVLIMPRMIWGVPSFRVISRLVRPWMPWPLQRQILILLSRVYHGRMEQWGFRTPRTRTHPASNATYMAHVSYRQIGVHPGVAGVDGSTIRFDDGTAEAFDVVIAATGYHIDMPFLAAGIRPVTERRLEAYRRIVHPDWPGLYFVGFFNVSGGANISMMDVQCEWMAALAGGEAGLPSREAMRADIEAERRFLAGRFPAAARYGLELDPVRYREQMAEAMAA